MNIPLAIDAKIDCLVNGVDIIPKCPKPNFVTKHEIKRMETIPQDLLIEDTKVQTTVEIQPKAGSPIRLMCSSDGSFKLQNALEGTDAPVHVSPISKPWWWNEHTSRGTPVRDYISIAGIDRLCIWLFKFCYYWFQYKQCQFCGISPARHRTVVNIPHAGELLHFNNVNAWWDSWKERGFLEDLSEAVEIVVSKGYPRPHFHLLVTSGNLLDADFPWKAALDIGMIIGKIIDLHDIDSHINLMPPKDFTLIKKALELGFTTFTFSLEVSEPTMFSHVCPGKAEHYGYNEMMKALQYTRKVSNSDIFVGAEFVLGLEPIDNLLNCARNLAEQGISSNANIFIPKPQAILRNLTPPSKRDILIFYSELGHLLRSHKLKPLYCELSLRTSLTNEAFQGWLGGS